VVSMHAWTHSIGSVHRGRRVGFQFAEDGADAGCLPLSSIMHAPQERWVEGCSTESVAKVKRSQEGVLKYWSHTIHYRSTKEFWFLDACAPPSMVDRVVVAAAFWEQYRGDALPACVGGLLSLVARAVA
jgi:hypothetical protein